MLRVIHNQSVQGAILVDDIDDGLPNKTVHRLGSQADPKAYKRDGYANASKQPCYVPFSHTLVGGGTVQGFITLNQTPKVIASAGNGKISKLMTAGLVTVVSLTAAQIAAPTVTGAVHGSPTTIAGTSLSSVAPDQTVVVYAAGSSVVPVPATLTQAQILAAGGSISAAAISIPASAFTTAPTAGNTVTVTSDELASNTFTLT